mgnify:FL=1
MLTLYLVSDRDELGDLHTLTTGTVKHIIQRGWGSLSPWPLDDLYCWSYRGDKWERGGTLEERRIDLYRDDHEQR